MDLDTHSDGAGDELAYWRRRALALAGALAVVGLLAWACSGDGEPGGASGAAGTPSPSGTPARLPGAVPTVTVTAKVTVPARPAGKKRQDDGTCRRGDVVVGFTVEKDAYRGSEQPRFRLSVVNLGERTCTYDVGPRALETRITSGPDRIWSSRHCVRGSGSSVRTLRRGIPYIETITWDRRRSSDGCRGERQAAAAGTYVAALKGDGVRAREQVFRLR